MADNAPYVPAAPNDIITSEKWNTLQSKARDELHNHKHTGDNAGPRLTGDAIDPGSTLTIARLGIGTATPNAPLSFGNGVANTKIALWDGGPTAMYGLGIQAAQFRLHTDNAGARFTFLNGPAGDELLNIYGNGVVAMNGSLGVGTAPNHKLHVKTDSAVGLFESTSNNAYLRVSTSEGIDKRVELCNRPGGRLALWVNGADVFNILQNGRVGIGGDANPLAKLSVVNDETDHNHNTAYFLAPKLGPNWSHIHWGPKGDWYIRSAANDGTVRIQDNGGPTTVGGPLTVQGGASGGAAQMEVYNPVNGKGQVAGLRFHTGSGWNVMLRTNQDNHWLELTDGNGGVNHHWNGGDYTATGSVTVNSVVRWNDPTDGNKFFQIYFERGNDTVVFYHNSGAGNYMRQDGIWQHNSDASLKENVAELSGILPRVAALRPVSFDWKSNGQSGIGFIAQEVERVFPDLVSEHEPEEGRKLKGLPYATFSVLAIAAVQEMKKEHDARIQAIEEKLAVISGGR